MKFRDGLFDFNNSSFRDKAIQLFHFQYAENAVYRSFCDALGRNPANVHESALIPFLPVSFFKTHAVTSSVFTPEMTFESSGTMGVISSRHAVKDLSLYRDSFLHGFRKFYGEPSAWCIIGLLPSYLERQQSSLVLMVDELVQLSGHPQSGFYLYDHERLQQNLMELESEKQPVLLIGVTFALLDFAEKYPMKLSHTVVMETGGMKGRREEMTRAEVHEILKTQWGLSHVHSEYGMTELLSQGYSRGEGIFYPSDTMQVLIREEDDPFAVHEASSMKQQGIINIIDLANIWSCAFIATEDAGNLLPDGSFEVIGRVDYSDIRGCSLMVV
jgi:hypothetical protein